MDGMEASVMDAPDVEIESGSEVEELGQELETEGQELETEGEAQVKDDPYTTKFSREYRAALKALETAHPEQAKYLKQARDNHARLFALTQLEPKGIDGVRERYAVLDSLSLGDAKGAEAITAMQERIQATEEVDSLLAAGNPKALDALGPDFDPGLAKLAPTILDRVRQTNPEAYQAAIQPHLVESLRTSELVQNYNALVDVLNTTDDPRLDDKTKLQMTIAKLGKMGQWLNAQSEKAGALAEVKPNQEADKFQQERTAFEKEKQEAHWNTNIKPAAVKMENDKFAEHLKPYMARLNLSEAQKTAALGDFKSKIKEAFASDKDFQRQMNIYRNQKNPDPSAVTNLLNATLLKKSLAAFDAVKAERWDSFLNGKPKPKPVTPGAVVKPAGPNVEIRTVKPPMHEIDHQNTPVDWLAQKKYRLFSGKVIQVRA